MGVGRGVVVLSSCNGMYIHVIIMHSYSGMYFSTGSGDGNPLPLRGLCHAPSLDHGVTREP